MTKISVIALSMMMAVTAVSCTGGNVTVPDDITVSTTAQTTTEVTTQQTDAEPVTGLIIPCEDNVKTLGRTYQGASGLWCALSGSGIEFTVKGATYCNVTLKGDMTALTGTSDQQARAAIYYNDNRAFDVMMDARKKEYTVFDGHDEKDCTIKVIKLSESANSVFAIESIETDGIIEPSPDKQMKLEFIGDSITCGYGVDDEDSSHHFSTKTEDCTKTYAYKTAQMLSADVSFCSFSGYGISSGYSDGKTQQKTQLVPLYYDKVGNSYSSFDDGVKPQNIDWDHSRYESDVIVINLGTNDNSWTKGKEDRIAEFTENYVGFIKHIREVHPDAYIICSLGIMGQELYPAVEAAAEGYRNETGDEKITCLKFDVQNMDDGIAADWHPSEKTHEKAAMKLTLLIQELTQQ